MRYQELRIQELVNNSILRLFDTVKMEHVPTGQTPRSIPVFVYGNLTQLCTPGDTVTISGVFIPASLV